MNKTLAMVAAVLFLAGTSAAIACDGDKNSYPDKNERVEAAQQ